MALLEVQHLQKIYTTRFGGNQVQALSNVNFSVEPGEYVAIMGESGSGKTTLLNILAALDRPTAGEVFLNGKALSDIRERDLAAFRRSHLGFVFQSYNLLPNLTATENVAMPLLFRGVPKQQREAAARKLLTRVGLAHRLDHFPRQMSGGQQQRVAIARAIAARPPMILADEPTGNLDSKSSRAVIRSFEQAKESLEATIFMVTHDSFAASFCDRVIILRDGGVWRTLARGEKDRRTFQDELLDAVREMGEASAQ